MQSTIGWDRERESISEKGESQISEQALGDHGFPNGLCEYGARWEGIWRR